MTNYQVVAIFTYPSDLVVVKTLLESNGINCYIRDELTVQVHNFYSNAIGGIRLEVPKEKLKLAEKTLIDNGFANFLAFDYDKKNQTESSLDSILYKFIKGGVKFVIIAVITLIVIIIGLIIFYE